MPWTVEFTARASKDRRRLDKTIRARVDAALLQLAAELTEHGRPVRSDLAKMQGRKDQWRLKIPDWRIIVSLERGRLVVLVLEVGNRGNIY